MANTLLLAFADQHPGSLPALEAEFDRLRELLTPLDAREYIRLVPYGKTGVGQLAATLNSYAGQLCLFHYSGHADGEQLALADGPGFGKGLAGLLGQEAGLKLVFLNGCATRGHVDELLEAGVKGVIATAAPVGDGPAAVFAVSFYRALANKRTVLEAFHFAKGEVELHFKQAPRLELRGIARPEAASSPTLPWGLYTRPESEPEVHHWRLPFYRDSGLTDFLKQDIRQRVRTNQAIVQVLDRMCQVNKDIHANYLVTYESGQARAVDPSSYLDAVIQNFPWVIGSQIGLLRQKTQPNRERLEQLLSTYILTGQLLYSILLSDCWEQKIRNRWSVPAGGTAFAAPPHSVDELKDTDFCRRLLDTVDFMNRRGGEFFAPELADFCRQLADPAQRLHKAWQLLESLRRRPPGPAELAAACGRAEAALAVFLMEAAFLAGYHLLTVRNIYLENARTRPVQYDLEMGRLNALASSSLGLYEDAAYRRKDSYAHSKSIVLTSSERDLRFSLSLTPFLIDLNTFLGEPLPYLFLFAYAEQDRYAYYSVNHDFFTALRGGTGFDLIHTDMTREMFDEGENDTSDGDEFPDDFDLFGAETAPAKEGVRIFALLEEQHARFRSDFTPSA